MNFLTNNGHTISDPIELLFDCICKYDIMILIITKKSAEEISPIDVIAHP